MGMRKEELRNTYFLSKKSDSNSFIGSRDRAFKMRQDLEKMLEKGEVEVDFSNVNIGQSFADELIGVLVLQHGPDILTKLIFKNCSDVVRTTIEFVVADRYDEFVRKKSH